MNDTLKRAAINLRLLYDLPTSIPVWWGAMGGVIIFTIELLESLALGLRDTEGSENSEEHEECEDLKNVVNPWGSGTTSCTLDCTTSTERCNRSLGDNGAEFA